MLFHLLKLLGWQSDLSEDELMKSFQESLNLGPDADGAAASGDFIPMMQNMMSNLLSKDILYPSLKDLADKVRFRIAF